METEEWLLEEDMKLLDAIYHCGYGNWSDISARFHNKTPLECENHYLEKFVINPVNEDLKQIAANCAELKNKSSLCSNCSLSVEESNQTNCQSFIQFFQLEQDLKNLYDNENSQKKDPVKFGKNEFNNSVKLNYMSKIKSLMSNISCNAYNPYRCEFDVEYDDKAEDILEMVCEPPESPSFSRNEDNLLIQELKNALVDSYNLRLSDRIRRKTIIRNHALIDRRKTYIMLQRLDVSFGSASLTSLVPFIKFMKGPNLDFLIEKLYYQNELRHKINSLLMYRSLGIRFPSGIHIYEKLNKKRLKHKKEIGYNGLPLAIDILESRNSRRPSAPLALYNLPGFNLLDEEEKHLCSNIRVVPETYYNFKQLLKSECAKHDGLKLAQARQLLKIDVNKTRKMYDFLISTGDIW